MNRKNQAKMPRQGKKSSCSLSTTKNCTDCKFQAFSKKLVTEPLHWALDRSIRFCIHWKTKDSSNLDGATTVPRKEGEHDDVTTSSPNQEAQLLNECKASETNCFTGPLAKSSHRSYQVDTPISRWIASPVVYLFPKSRREEWLGDLYELHIEMQQKDYPPWIINTIDILRTVILIFSAIKITVADLIIINIRTKE